jgi:hypothetical protein
MCGNLPGKHPYPVEEEQDPEIYFRYFGKIFWKDILESKY